MTDLLTLEAAIEAVLVAQRAAARGAGARSGEAAGRVLAEPARARVDLPPFASSAMDGFALRSADTPGRLPVVARIAAGSPAPAALRPGEAMGIATGGVVPEGADAVVPIERVVQQDDSIEVPIPLAKVTTSGRAAATRAKATSCSRRVRASALRRSARSPPPASRSSSARDRPRVAVLATGSELRTPGEHARARRDLRGERGDARGGASRARRRRRAACARARRRGRAPRRARARAAGATSSSARAACPSGRTTSCAASPRSSASRKCSGASR